MPSQDRQNRVRSDGDAQTASEATGTSVRTSGTLGGRAPGELARGGYQCGRRDEQRGLAEWLQALAAYVGNLVAFAYLDGREDAGEEQGDIDDERAELAHLMRARSTSAFLGTAFKWRGLEP